MPRSRRIVVALRELASLRKEKTIVLALLIQLFVAMFSSFLVVGLVSMYDPGSVDNFEVDVAVTGDETGDLMAVMADDPAIDGERYISEEQALQSFEEFGSQAVIITERTDTNRIRAHIIAPEGSFQTTLVVVKLRDVMRAYETELREDRQTELTHDLVPMPPESSSSPYFGFTYTVLVPLLLFLPTFIGGSIAVDSLSEEVERGTLELLRVTPTTLPEIIDGKLIAAAGPVPLQVALWLGLLEFNGTRIVHIPELLVFSAAVATAVCALGLGVAAATRDRRLAQFLYSSGILVLFGATFLLPENPANTVARFAIGSAGASTYWSLIGTVVLAITALVVIRSSVTRVNTDAL